MDQPALPPRKRLLQVTALAWLAVTALDFLLNAGLFAPFYRWDHAGFLSPMKMFQYIPIGYASFLLWTIALVWLIARTGVLGAAAGARFGAKLGLLLGGAGFLGGLSIYSFPPVMLFFWALCEALMFTLAGAVIGGSLTAPRLRPTVRRVVVLTAVCVAATIAMQSFGLVPNLVPQGGLTAGSDAKP